MQAQLRNDGADTLTVHLVATQGGATVFDESLQVAGGAVAERALGDGTMTVKATYAQAKTTSLTLGGGDCADGTTVAAFSFSQDAGAWIGGVKVACGA